MCPCKHHYKRSAVCTCDCSHGRVRVIEDEAVAGVVGPNSAGIFIPDGAFDITEPEDKDDLYVEPEPLKEGDWVQVWAQVREFKSESLASVVIKTRHGHMPSLVPDPDAIVRPDAGQVPPWVKPVEEPEPSASEVIMAVLTQSSAEMARRMQVFADAAEEFGRRLREQIEGRHDTEGGAS